MTRSAAIALILVATVTAAGATTAATTAAVLYGGGALSVEVEQRGADPLSLRFSVPAIAIGPAMDWALNRWEPASVELPEGVDGRWLQAAAASVRALEQAPDGVLVHVEDGTDSVLVISEGGELVVEVASRNERVRVSVPLRLIARLIDRMDSLDLPPRGRA
jgi:hypothetical protein